LTTVSVLADFADILAALAIILSLIFVACERHQNRTQAELSNRRELLQTLVDHKGLTHDPERAAFITRAPPTGGATASVWSSASTSSATSWSTTIRCRENSRGSRMR